MKDKEKTDKSIIELIIPISTRFLSFGRLFFSSNGSRRGNRPVIARSFITTYHTHKTVQTGPFSMKSFVGGRRRSPLQVALFFFLP